MREGTEGKRKQAGYHEKAGSEETQVGVLSLAAAPGARGRAPSAPWARNIVLCLIARVRTRLRWPAPSVCAA